MPAGDKNDPFLRKWLRILTQDLSDPKYLRLSYAERGVYVDLNRYSLRSSDVPGYFMFESAALALDDILRGIAPRDLDQMAIAHAAIPRLRDEGWLSYDDEIGWSLPRWADVQFQNIVESETAKRTRIGAAARQRARRDRQREGIQPVPIRRHETGDIA